MEATGPVTSDPLIGLPVQILGVGFGADHGPGRLVDVNPYNATSSQIFFDSFQLGNSTVGVVGKRIERFADRAFFFSRNLNFDGKVMIAAAWV